MVPDALRLHLARLPVLVDPDHGRREVHHRLDVRDVVVYDKLKVCNTEMDSNFHWKVTNINNIYEQECIPVGCVSIAAVAATRCQYPRGLSG